MRISLEDKGLGESCSIKNQRILLNQFLDGHKTLAGRRRVEICDDGYSGTNFQRPGILEMLALAGRQEICCVVVKDFSRFGRNYIEVGDYLEQTFPSLGLRFISVGDGYDSAAEGPDFDAALRNLLNDLYSKDLSIKCKSGKISKMRQGSFTSPFAPYGYVKSVENKGKLVAKPATAEVVRLIFKLAADGKKPTEIAEVLNLRGFLSPRGNLWGGSTIHRILRDERYTGDMVSRKTERMVVGNPNLLKVLSKEDWIVVPNTHEAIISKDLFERVQGFIKSRPKRKKRVEVVYMAVNSCGEQPKAAGLEGMRKDLYKMYQDGKIGKEEYLARKKGLSKGLL